MILKKGFQGSFSRTYNIRREIRKSPGLRNSAIHLRQFAAELQICNKFDWKHGLWYHEHIKHTQEDTNMQEKWLPGTLRERIRDLCKSRDISQTNLAQELGVQPPSLYNHIAAF